MDMFKDFRGGKMFDYNKTIQKNLEILQKYEEPHALEKHMKDLYKTWSCISIYVRGVLEYRKYS